jgi:hypothetical protein
MKVFNAVRFTAIIVTPAAALSFPGTGGRGCMAGRYHRLSRPWPQRW